MKFGRCESCGSFNDHKAPYVEPNLLNLAIQKEIIKSKANKLNQIKDPPESHFNFNFFTGETGTKSPVSPNSIYSRNLYPNKLKCFNR